MRSPSSPGLRPTIASRRNNPKTVAGLVGKQPNAAANVTAIVIWTRKMAAVAAGALVEAAWVIGASTKEGADSTHTPTQVVCDKASQHLAGQRRQGQEHHSSLSSLHSLARLPSSSIENGNALSSSISATKHLDALLAFFLLAVRAIVIFPQSLLAFPFALYAFRDDCHQRQPKRNIKNGRRVGPHCGSGNRNNRCQDCVLNDVSNNEKQQPCWNHQQKAIECVAETQVMRKDEAPGAEQKQQSPGRKYDPGAPFDVSGCRFV